MTADLACVALPDRCASIPPPSNPPSALSPLKTMKSLPANIMTTVLPPEAAAAALIVTQQGTKALATNASPAGLQTNRSSHSSGSFEDGPPETTASQDMLRHRMSQYLAAGQSHWAPPKNRKEKCQQ